MTLIDLENIQPAVKLEISRYRCMDA